MPHSPTVDGSPKSGWLMVALVVGSVSAASLALGLGVVGPMIQRRTETPPPALSTSGTSTPTPSRLPAPSADVVIKERVVRRPVPKPVPPAATDPLADSSQTLPGGGAPAESTDTPASGASGRPSIHATVTDADLDSQPDGASAPGATGARMRRSPTRSAGSKNGDAAGAGGAGKGPKARDHRVSPLEALPPLDADGPGTAAEDVKPGTVVPPAPVTLKSGRSYRVQVGRFDNQRAAERLRDELAKTGFSPRVVKTERGGTVQYRVQIGTFRQKENAVRQIEKLKGQSYQPYLAEEEP